MRLTEVYSFWYENSHFRLIDTTIDGWMDRTRVVSGSIKAPPLSHGKFTFCQDQPTEFKRNFWHVCNYTQWAVRVGGNFSLDCNEVDSVSCLETLSKQTGEDFGLWRAPVLRERVYEQIWKYVRLDPDGKMVSSTLPFLLFSQRSFQHSVFMYGSLVSLWSLSLGF